MTLPFHKLTTKKIGDRVKVPKVASNESHGFYYGTVVHRAPSDELMVEWDQYIPHLGKYTDTLCAILV